MKKNNFFGVTLFLSCLALHAHAQENMKIRLEYKDAKLYLFENEVKTQISDSDKDSLAIFFQGNVYYTITKIINNSEQSELFSYDIKTKSSQNLSADFGKDILSKGRIVRLIVDKKNQRLIYTIQKKEEQNIAQYISCRYDIKSHEHIEYKDGIIESLGMDNTQTFSFFGLDETGAYQKTFVYDENGGLVKVSDKKPF